MKKLSWIPAAVAGCLLLVTLLYLAVISFAFTPAVYPQDPPYDAMAQALTDYLSGEVETLPDTLFNEQERLHMDDVLVLFQGGERLAWVCLGIGCALALISLIWGGRANLGKGLLIGMAVFAGLAIGIALWAVIDFNGWFTTMHEWVFTNDLWLFDPADSMLINMLPLDFFIGAVGTIGLRFGLGAVVLLLLAVALRQPKRPRRGLWATTSIV